MERIAVFPGSFDPFTIGHHDLIHRALEIVDRVIVAIAVNVNKRPLFTMDERMQLVRAVFAEHPRVEVDSFQGLVVHYAQSKNARCIVRGLRSASDFAYELPMAHMNRTLTHSVDTLFLAGEPHHAFISSSLVKEVASMGGDVTAFVPPVVAQALAQRIARPLSQG